MIEALKEEVPSASNYGRIENTVLAIGALLNRKQPTKSTYLDPKFSEQLYEKWEKVVRGLEDSTDFLKREAIFDGCRLPSDVILYLSGALWANVSKGGDEEGRHSSLIRKAIWRASFTDRYQTATAQKAAADYKAILDLFRDPNSNSKPKLFNETEHSLPKSGKLIRSKWPKKKERLGRAILAASLYKGGYDFADDNPVDVGNIADRHYHHVYPEALIRGKYPDEMVDSAINCALISGKTNLIIGADTPKEYLEERTKHAPTKVVKLRLESHLIPYDSLVGDDFPTFLNKRAKLIHKAMQRLCSGERLHRL